MIKYKYFLIMIFTVTFSGCSTLVSREPAANTLEKPIQRQYQEGEVLKYRIQMSHFYDGSLTSKYDAVATGVVKKDTQGSFSEEFQWTSISDDDKQAKFTETDNNFRQILSLSPPFKLSIPKELTSLSHFLIGPVTDFLTFYVDESLIIRKASTLQKSGDHIYLNTAVASSWGAGQDCLDFNVLLSSVDHYTQVAQIVVSHLPPSKICITPPAQWMTEQVTDSPNNWYNIENENGKWLASTGKETFDVQQVIDISNGKTLSATMDNPVEFQTRICADEKLSNCSKPTTHKIVRKLTLTLM